MTKNVEFQIKTLNPNQKKYIFKYVAAVFNFLAYTKFLIDFV